MICVSQIINAYTLNLYCMPTQPDKNSHERNCYHLCSRKSHIAIPKEIMDEGHDYSDYNHWMESGGSCWKHRLNSLVNLNITRRDTTRHYVSAGRNADLWNIAKKLSLESDGFSWSNRKYRGQKNMLTSTKGSKQYNPEYGKFFRKRKSNPSSSIKYGNIKEMEREQRIYRLKET